MGRTPLLSLGRSLAVIVGIAAAPLLAASSVLTNASLTIVQPSSTTTEQDMVIGSVVVPLKSNLGVSAGSIGLPPPSQGNPLGNLRIGAESIQREIGQVVSRTGLQQASFTIVGDRDQVVSINVPETISLQQLGGQGEVAFNPVTSLSSNGFDRSRLAAGSGSTGELAFDVGGRVQDSPTATAGDYAGVLKVTVQYN
jgi:hypothetical protein